MAAGLPTVAADSPAARSVLSDGEEGYLVPGEPEAMANAVLRLADRGEEWHRLSDTGRVSALRFGIEEAGRKLRAIYCAAIDARGCGRQEGMC
jgi:glycosyltransferase involved in cell wall biosynthesis